jgi:hypothetical protein
MRRSPAISDTRFVSDALSFPANPNGYPLARAVDGHPDPLDSGGAEPLR